MLETCDLEHTLKHAYLSNKGRNISITVHIKREWLFDYHGGSPAMPLTEVHRNPKGRFDRVNDDGHILGESG